MPTLTPSPFAAVLTAIENQLQSSTGLPDERVNVTGWDVVPDFQGDQDILIRAGNPSPHMEDMESKGRLMTRIVRPVEVQVRARVALDPTGYSDIALLDPALGLFALEEAAVNALHGFVPVDGNGNWLTTEEMRLIPSTRPTGNPDDPREWTSSRMTFEVTYILKLNPQQEL